MNINADFSQRAVVHAASMPWVDSPMQGVQRRMLDRVGDEIARATSIVRYAPGSRFSEHTHDGGEEFLVLEGVFQDEHGDYPAGTYVRNPPTTHHVPGSQPGCVIFVKLWQFDPGDRKHVVINSKSVVAVRSATRNGVSIFPLHEDPRETVRLETWDANVMVELQAPHGVEVLVLEGEFVESGERFTTYSWLRIPAGGALRARTGQAGAKIWMKLSIRDQLTGIRDQE